MYGVRFPLWILTSLLTFVKNSEYAFAQSIWTSLFNCPILFGQSYDKSALSEFKETYISLLNLILSYLKKLFIRYSRSSRVLSFNEGIVITIGILLLKVLRSAESGFSVVAEIIKTSDFLDSESPTRLKVPVSRNTKRASWPSGGSLCTSSRNKIPPSACSINPVLSHSAPV